MEGEDKIKKKNERKRMHEIIDNLVDIVTYLKMYLPRLICII